jgi:hypothetical protein
VTPEREPRRDEPLPGMEPGWESGWAVELGRSLASVLEEGAGPTSVELGDTASSDREKDTHNLGTPGGRQLEPASQAAPPAGRIRIVDPEGAG